jgi:hypothetical protein
VKPVRAGLLAIMASVALICGASSELDSSGQTQDPGCLSSSFALLDEETAAQPDWWPYNLGD